MKHPSVFSHMTTKLVAVFVLSLFATTLWADNYYFTASAQGGEGGNVYISTQNELSSMGLFSLDANHGKSTFPFDFAQYKLNDVTYGYMIPEMYYQFGSIWYCYSSTSVECTTPMEQLIDGQPMSISAHDLAHMYFSDDGYFSAMPIFYVFTHANPGYICTGVTAPEDYTRDLSLINDGSYHIYLGANKLNGWNAATNLDEAIANNKICNVGTFTAQFAKSHVTGLNYSIMSTDPMSPTVMTASTMAVDVVFNAVNFSAKEDFVISGVPEGVTASVNPANGTILFQFTISATGVNGTHSKEISVKGAAEDDTQKQTVTIYWSENNITRDALQLPLHFENEEEFNMITLYRGTGISYGGPNKVNYDGVGEGTWKVHFSGRPGAIRFTTDANSSAGWEMMEGSTSACSNVIMSGGNISGEYRHTLKESSQYVSITFPSGTANVISDFSIATYDGFSMNVDGVAIPLQETPAQKEINIVAVDNSTLTVSCTDADFECNLYRNPNGKDAVLTIVNHAKIPKVASITISAGSQSNTIPVISFIAPIKLPIDLTNSEDPYLFYELVDGSKFASWNPSSRIITLGESQGVYERYVVLRFNGTPDELSFLYTAGTNGLLAIQCSADNTIWNDVEFVESYVQSQIQVSASLPQDARYVRIQYVNTDRTKSVALEQLRITSGIPQGTGAFRIGSSYFTTLEDALAYANNHKTETLTILALEDYTLPAGNYTLPANATLLVPCCAEQTEPMGTTTVALDNYTVPSAYRTLTFADGVNLNVYGKIEVSGRIYSAQPELSAPCGTYGQLVMNTGSRVTLNSGAFLLVYGFATGNGEIIVNNGADTQELFQVMDWKGGVASATIAGVLGDNPEETLAKKVFIVNQYYFQSIEVPTVYRAGSHAYGMLNVQVYGEIKIDTRVMVVGLTDENAMFKMDEDKATDKNVWVRKRYDAVNDRQVYEINSSAYLGSMVIDAMGFAFNSADYVLPITSNFNIHVLSGTMGITENTLLLPGATIEVDKEATAYIDDNKSLYVCGKDNWGKYVYARSGYTYGTHVRYTPDWGTSCPRACTTLDDLGDATINVHGTFEVIGKLLTSESGANIFSTNADAGTILFYNAGITAGETVWQVTSNTPTFESFACVPAILRNGDNTTASISGAAEGTSYCYYDNRWRTMFVDEDNPAFVYDNYATYYAKPSDYVAIQLTKTAGEFIGNDDHTFSSLDGQRLFILRDADSQWWEVTIQNNYYYCAKNGKYYYYDEDEEDWIEKTFTVTWKNFDGTTLHMSEDPVVYAEYQVVYGTLPEYLGSTPTREATADYTYDFIGWTPDIAPVTGDVVYTAKYQETQRKYTVIFLNENGGEIERHFYALGDMPECENVPTKSDLEKSYTLIWEPAIGAVNGDQTYRATFLENAPTEYTIRFVNYDGTELQSSSVAVGTLPAYTGQTPTKPSTFDDDFTFSGWSPALKPVDGAITYTATFDKTKKTYAIRFFESDGTTQIGATQTLEVGATPQVPAYTHAPQSGHTFTLYWTPAVGTVTGAQDYVGRFTDEVSRYAITLVAPHATVAGAGVYDYDEDPEAVSITLTPDENYTFVHWLDENGVIVSTDPSFTTSVTANRTFTAVLNGPVTYTVAYKGNGATKGSTMSSRHICGVDHNLTLNGFSRVGYTFAGWNTAADGTGTSFTDGQTVRDLSLVQESTVNLYAQWTPRTDIAYTVEYFRENIGGSYPDNPQETVAKTDGTADALMSITPEKSYVGYATPVAQFVTIAANGTTIVKFYYTRATVAMADYTVNHYQQNLADDLYTLIDTENLQANANSSVTPATKVYEGFTAPATQTKTITADGQLLIEYYYTRNKYLITFKDGNNAVLQTSQVKYGATPQYEGTAPQKAATAEYTYTFSTWSPAVEPATAAATYTATFTQAANSYTISWVTDGDALTGNYTTGSVAYGTKIVQPNMPTKAGATFAGWTPSVPGTMPAADISFTATFVTTSDAVYYVRYNAPGATGSMLVSSHVLGAPSRLNKNTFVRTGYVFLGWTTGRTAGVEYADEAEITDLTTVPNAIVQLYACWSFEAAVLYDAPTAGQTLQQAADALQMQLTNLRQSCEDNPDLRCDVTIHRTLRHDGSLQPICLPFSVAAADIAFDATCPLYQAAIYSYDYRVKTVSSTVDVMIRRVNHIIAGVPYLIKFQSGSDQQKLEFHGVRFTADNALIEESAPMNYVGALLPEAKVSGQNVLYVGDNNQLEWWNGEGETYLRGFRGFFQLNASGQRSIRRGMVVNLIEQEDDAQKETPTGMDENQNQNEEVKKVIIDNQLYIIRRGTYYNALGTPVYMEIIMDM